MLSLLFPPLTSLSVYPMDNRYPTVLAHAATTIECHLMTGCTTATLCQLPIGTHTAPVRAMEILFRLLLHFHPGGHWHLSWITLPINHHGGFWHPFLAVLPVPSRFGSCQKRGITWCAWRAFATCMSRRSRLCTWTFPGCSSDPLDATLPVALKTKWPPTFHPSTHPSIHSYDEVDMT